MKDLADLRMVLAMVLATPLRDLVVIPPQKDLMVLTARVVQNLLKDPEIPTFLAIPEKALDLQIP